MGPAAVGFSREYIAHSKRIVGENLNIGTIYKRVDKTQGRVQALRTGNKMRDWESS